MYESNLQVKVYHWLARQIVNDYGITEGRCLDIGAGTGLLGLEIAKITDIKLFLLDFDSVVLREAERICQKGEMANRTSIIQAFPREGLPFINSYFDLVVSRGSFFPGRIKPRG